MQSDPELYNATVKTPRFSIDGEYIAKCVDVHDGDTCQLVFKVSETSHLARFTCRILGYNCAEVAGVGISDVEKERGKICRDFMRKLILGKIVNIIVNGFDRHGRPLVNIWIDISAEIGVHAQKHVSVSELILLHGYGVKYDGTGEKQWKGL